MEMYEQLRCNDLIGINSTKLKTKKIKTESGGEKTRRVKEETKRKTTKSIIYSYFITFSHNCQPNYKMYFGSTLFCFFACHSTSISIRKQLENCRHC